MCVTQKESRVGKRRRQLWPSRVDTLNKALKNSFSQIPLIPRDFRIYREDSVALYGLEFLGFFSVRFVDSKHTDTSECGILAACVLQCFIVRETHTHTHAHNE